MSTITTCASGIACGQLVDLDDATLVHDVAPNLVTGEQMRLAFCSACGPTAVLHRPTTDQNTTKEQESNESDQSI